MSNHSVSISILLNVWAGDDPALLRRCLNSVIHQTVLPYEILIVSDGPLPISLQQIIEQELMDFSHLVRTISTQNHLGLWNARNVGLRNAAHNWVVLQDADDIMHPQRLETLVPFTTQNEFHVISTAMLEFDISSRKCVGIRSNKDSGRLDFRVNNPINHPTVMLNRDAVLSCGGYRDFYLMEDYDLWLRMCHQGYLFKYLPFPTVAFSVSRKLFSRRGGSRFLQSESQLRREKNRLQQTSQTLGLMIFAIRVSYRLLPSGLRRLIHFKLLSRPQYQHLTLDKYLTMPIADLN